jgi:hypothetical protein
MADSPAVIARKYLYGAFETLDNITNPRERLHAELQVGALAAQIEIANQLEGLRNEIDALRNSLENGLSELK